MKILLFSLFFCFNIHCQSSKDISWNSFQEGIDTAEYIAIEKSILGDSKLFLVRIDPQKVVFELKCATSEKIEPLTVEGWAEVYGYSLVFNAGMYDLIHQKQSRGHMKDRKSVNNPTIHPKYNGWFSIDTLTSKAKIHDLEAEGLQTIEAFSEGFQAMRMLNNQGNPMDWSKKKQACSMLTMSIDSKGLIYLIFCRSPYLHATMISFIKSLPIDLKTTLYLEGGPETSVFLKNEKATIRKIGSYVSDTYPTDANSKFWKLPNVVGIKLRTISVK